MATVEVQYKSQDGRFTTKFTGETNNQIFEQLSGFQEVFEKHNECGLCGERVFYNVRKVDKSKFFEKKCADPKCGAALTYHINDGNVGLYTTWKDEWKKWVPTPKDDDGKVFEDSTKTSKKGK